MFPEWCEFPSSTMTPPTPPVTSPTSPFLGPGSLSTSMRSASRREGPSTQPQQSLRPPRNPGRNGPTRPVTRGNSGESGSGRGGNGQRRSEIRPGRRGFGWEHLRLPRKPPGSTTERRSSSGDHLLRRTSPALSRLLRR
uniref:Uncharacterized protein n=1 Tax=Opuntia streptacantha TaxID=393608 RepID=A0A7C9AW67_OPUST